MMAVIEIQWRNCPILVAILNLGNVRMSAVGIFYSRECH